MNLTELPSKNNTNKAVFLRLLTIAQRTKGSTLGIGTTSGTFYAAKVYVDWVKSLVA